MFKILVAEDDPNTRKLMTAVLKGAGYDVLTAANGMEAWQMLDDTHVDILLVDVMMPVMDGVTLTRRLRQCGSDLPIIMVTALGDMQDKRVGFNAGADDYVTKPIHEEELLLRIKAMLRRAQIVAEKRIIVGSTTLHYDTMTVETAEGEMTLPKKEFLLLYELLSYPNKIYTKNDLMTDIWGDDSDSTEQTVIVHINRLRTKFEHNPDFEIVTMRGLGYKAVIKK